MLGSPPPTTRRDPASAPSLISRRRQKVVLNLYSGPRKCSAAAVEKSFVTEAIVSGESGLREGPAPGGDARRSRPIGRPGARGPPGRALERLGEGTGRRFLWRRRGAAGGMATLGLGGVGRQANEETHED
jgi:hypothetical protein